MNRMLAVAALLVVSPVVAAAQITAEPPRQSYVAAKLGAIVPQHDDLEGFDSGGAFELAFGRRVNPNFAVEGSIGRFSYDGSGTFSDGAGGFLSVDTTLSAVPVTVTAKVIAPAGGIDFFALAGAGLYFVSQEADVTDGLQSVRVSDDDTAFGLHLGGGLAAHVSSQLTIGADVRYFVAEPTLFDVSSNMDSVLVGATVGFAF